MSDWINIDEERPVKIKKYKVLLNEEHEYEATWHPGKGENGMFVDINLMMELPDVTHWKDNTKYLRGTE
jgi:hypothetical protein